MADTTYPLELNFLALDDSQFHFGIYRKAIPSSSKHVRGVRFLPVGEVSGEKSADRPKRERYEVSYEDKAGFEPYSCFSWSSVDLTLEVLSSAIRKRTEQNDLKSVVVQPKNEFDRRFSFVLSRHPEGEEVVWLRPYALRRTGQFGFLTRFSFHSNQYGSVPTRRVQHLSLSLKSGRPNRDYYAEHYEKVLQFLSTFGAQVTQLTLHDGSTIRLSLALCQVHGSSLNERVYVLANGVEVTTPFQGLRQNAPLKRSTENAQLVFLFLEQDRRRSQEFFRALRGDLYTTFPGMGPLFGCPIDKNNTSGMVIQDFSHESLSGVAESLVKRFDSTPIVPIALVPFKNHHSEEDTNGYYTAKHAFLQFGLPSQFVNRDRFDDKESMKWSISNLGLAIFAKMGGSPWKVKPTTPKCLIVGIGQAHRIVGKVVTKYLAYSVLTDSSGMYENIHVLGSSTSENEYLAGFRANLKQVLLDHSEHFDSFVIHATFSLRRRELEAINSLLEDLTKEQGKGKAKEFAAFKFNEINDFFAYSSVVNSKVPFESTYIKLSAHEYLLWFDGLNRQNPTVSRRPERPVHLQVLFPQNGLPGDTAMRYFQDSVNIAGANWRGFNARSMPISVYYARLIARYYGYFQQLGLRDLELENISPWFL